jgi:hypothetical protein
VHSVDVSGCHIRKEDENLAFTYSATKLDLTQSQSQDVSELLSPGEFAVVAEELSAIVVPTLEVNVFPRIGFRLWTLYETESLDDASARIDRMSFFAPSKALAALGERSHVSHTVVIARRDHLVRVAATPIEQQIALAPSVIAAARTESHRQWKDQRKSLIQKMKAKKAIKAYPPLGILIDLDAYIEEVPFPDQVSARTFIEEAARDFDAIREAILLEEDRP